MDGIFKMFAIVVNLATGQAQPMLGSEVYSTFEECTAAIPGKYAPAKEMMSQNPPQMLMAMGCGYHPKPPGA